MSYYIIRKFPFKDILHLIIYVYQIIYNLLLLRMRYGFRSLLKAVRCSLKLLTSFYVLQSYQEIPFLSILRLIYIYTSF